MKSHSFLTEKVAAKLFSQEQNLSMDAKVTSVYGQFAKGGERSAQKCEPGSKTIWKT